jgi:hypothetical protein
MPIEAGLVGVDLAVGRIGVEVAVVVVGMRCIGVGEGVVGSCYIVAVEAVVDSLVSILAEAEVVVDSLADTLVVDIGCTEVVEGPEEGHTVVVAGIVDTVVEDMAVAVVVGTVVDVDYMIVQPTVLGSQSIAETVRCWRILH